MGSFSVKIEQMEEIAVEIQSIGSTLEKKIVELGKARSQIDACMSTSGRGSARRISQLENRVRKLSRDIQMLSGKLKTISGIYQNYENRISGASAVQDTKAPYGKSTSGNGEEDSSTIFDRIKDWLSKIKKAGIDANARYSADPVNLSTGNYVYENNFFQYDTPIPVNLRLFYNVQNREIGMAGKGWTTSYEKSLHLEKEHAWISDEDGSTTEFYLTANGAFISVFASNDLLLKEGGEYLFKDENKNCFRFNGKGRLLEAFPEDETYKVNYEYEEDRLVYLRDSYGLSYSMDYTEEGRVCSITDCAGRSVLFSYKGDLLVEVTDSEGNSTGYGYDNKDRLDRIISPKGECVLRNWFDEQDRTVRQAFADGGEVSFSYRDDEGSVMMTQQNGTVITYEHDERFRHVRTVYPDGKELFAYNEDNRLISETDARGNTRSYEYDPAGMISKIISPLGDILEIRRNNDGQISEVLLNEESVQKSVYDRHGRQTVSTDANGNSVFFEYDAYGNVSGCTHEDGSRSSYVYNEKGDLIKVSVPGQGETTYEYDSCRRVTASVDALGNRTEYEYDRNDNLVRVINAEGEEQRYEYDKSGNVTKITGFGGGTEVIRYNCMNKPVIYIDEDGFKTEYEYDNMWNLTGIKLPDGTVRKYGYDGRGRLVSIIDPEGNVQTAEYDACGNIVRRTAEDGAVYQIEYDAMNRPVTVIDPVGVSRSAKYDSLGNVVEVDYGEGIREAGCYDLMGNLVSYTDKTGNTRKFRYTPRGDVQEISDEKGWLSRYEYYPGGLLKKELYSDGRWKEYAYDRCGKVISINDESEGGWRFTYDVLGRVTEAEHIDDKTEKYEYDAVGNLTAVIDGNGNRTAYSYSPAGDLLRMRDAEGNETGYLYDSCHRLIHILQPENGKLDVNSVEELNDLQGDIRITSFLRDSRGNVIGRTNPEGYEAKFMYDACGRLSSVTDEDGNTIKLQYNADGMRRSVELPDAKSIKYQYNDLKQLVRIEDWIGRIKMQQDPENRLLRVVDQNDRVVSYQWDADRLSAIRYPDGKSAEYKYNEKRQIECCSYQDITYTLEYGKDGRLNKRTSSEGVTTELKYNRAGYPVRIKHSNRGSLEAFLGFQYDGCGRMKEAVRRMGEQAEHHYSYGYNSVGMLASVKKDESPAAVYSYDKFGNRVSSREGNETTTFTYNRLNQLVSMKGEGEKRTCAYDRRGNLKDVFLNDEPVLKLSFNALNQIIGAESPKGHAEYTYNGLFRRTSAIYSGNGKTVKENYIYDYTKGAENLLSRIVDLRSDNLLWCDELLLIDHEEGWEQICLDERRSGILSFGKGLAAKPAVYGAFGAEADCTTRMMSGFAGYSKDPITGLLHANQREYDPRSGRFISMDALAGMAAIPYALNGYLYCFNDPVNAYDPTGLIAAWLAGGIVGALVRTGTKFAGDVVKSVVSGKPQFSSWQSYVGAAAGGFTEGSTFVAATIASGGNMKVGMTAAGAAGNAVDTLVTNGLSMATHAKGYENYSMLDLMKDTATSAASGAAAGFVFGSAAKTLKIPGITKGRGSFQAVFKAGITKGIRYGFNMSWKTVMKGAVAYGIVGTADKIYNGLKDEGKKYVKQKAVDLIKNIINPNKSSGAAAATAACAATGSRPKAA